MIKIPLDKIIMENQRLDKFRDKMRNALLSLPRERKPYQGFSIENGL
jgi:hypothetical protein